MATGKFFNMTVEGDNAILEYATRMEEALASAAPALLEEAAEIPMRMMRNLVRKRTGKLQRSIRFTFGERAGTLQATQRRGGRSPTGKLRAVGYIVAGDKTTLVKGAAKSSRQRLGKKRSRSHLPGGLWQNAILQEFGTTSMKAKPFFFVSWRATRKRVKKSIGDGIGVVLRNVRKSKPGTTAPAKAA